MDKELLVKSIKNICKKNNVTVSELENKLGFSPALISRWNKTNPSIDRIIDIADYFHVSLDEIVGRNKDNVNDEFLNVLYKKTSNREVQWKSYNKENQESGLKQYIYHFEYDGDGSQEDYINFQESRKQISYYFEYMQGYISIYAFYSYHEILKPHELKLFIQPDLMAELIPQPYQTEDLRPLWIKVLSSLDDNAPDEIKAENLKNEIIIDQKEKKKHNLNLQKVNFKEIDKIMSSDQFRKVQEYMASEEFQKLESILGSKEFPEILK